MAICDYDAENINELSFLQGDILKIVEKGEDWSVAINSSGTRGEVPSYYFEVFDYPLDNENKIDNEIFFLKEDCTQTIESVGDKCPVPDIILFDCEADSEKDLSLMEGDGLNVVKIPNSNCWEATNTQGKTGNIPSNCLKQIFTIDMDLSCDISKDKQNETDEINILNNKDKEILLDEALGKNTNLISLLDSSESLISVFDSKRTKKDRISEIKYSGSKQIAQTYTQDDLINPVNGRNFSLTEENMNLLDQEPKTDGGRMVTTIVSASSLSDRSMSLNTKSYIREAESAVIALFDCDADEEDELSFRKGEKLNVIDKSDPEWWRATNTLGETGIIPSNFVEIITPTECDIQPEIVVTTFEIKNEEATDVPNCTILSSEDTTNNENETKEKDSDLLFVCICDYKGLKIGDLTIKKGENIKVIDKSNPEVWFASNFIGETGLVPSSNLQEISTDDTGSLLSAKQIILSNRDDESVKDEESDVSSSSVSIISKCVLGLKVERTSVCALFDFQADEKWKLPFFKGDILTVLEKPDPGWWKAINSQGVSGLIPSNYVKETCNTIETQTPNTVQKNSSNDRNKGKINRKNHKSNFYDAGSSKITELSMIKPTICVVVAINDYDSDVIGQLSFSKGDRLNVTDKSDLNWWCAKNSDHEEGLIPSIYVREIFNKQVVVFPKLENILPAEKKIKKPTKQIKPSKHLQKSVFYIDESVSEKFIDVAEALFDFNGDMDDEISFSKGEKLSIIDKSGKDWWQASNTRGEIGSIPSSYVKSLSKKNSSPLGSLNKF